MNQRIFNFNIYQNNCIQLDVARDAVRLVIDTLSPSDYFNVIVFNDDARPLSCFNDTLARATNYNKVSHSPQTKQLFYV